MSNIDPRRETKAHAEQDQPLVYLSTCVRDSETSAVHSVTSDPTHLLPEVPDLRVLLHNLTLKRLLRLLQFLGGHVQLRLRLVAGRLLALQLEIQREGEGGWRGDGEGDEGSGRGGERWTALLTRLLRKKLVYVPSVPVQTLCALIPPLELCQQVPL